MNFILRRRTVLAVLVVLLVFGLLFVHIATNQPSKETADSPDVFVGVDVGYGDENDVYKVADVVAGYANLIVLGALNVTKDTAALTRVCDFLYQKDFYFIIYVGFSKVDFLPPRGPDAQFFNETQGRWGNKFLGIYLFDEIGGKQLDSGEKVVMPGQLSQRILDERDYTYVAEAYVAGLIGYSAVSLQWYAPPYPNYSTSDYALYWYDYLSGYNTVFTQFVGNQSRQLSISLCRGAAHTLSTDVGHTQGQDWGVIITWKYDQAPYLEDAGQLYDDMMLAYQNQAKYIIVFNSAENNTQPTPVGTLTTEHLDAMKQFWDCTKNNPRSEVYPADTAYVLPRDYGFGFRNPNDTIWGIWSADALAPKVWNDTNSLLATYGSKLDIVYETKLDGESITLPYSKLIFWNGTITER